MDQIKGLYTALITPFNNEGGIDEEGFRSNITYQLENGVDGLVVLGTTGESPTLSAEEKLRLIKIAREESEGRAPLIVGTGSYSTQQSVENTRIAKQSGADAALVITPYYNKPTQEGLYQHYAEIASSVSIPLIIYNHPGRCGNSMEVETMRRLAGITNIIGVKEVTGSIDRINELMEALSNDFPGFSILSGDDSATYTLIANGGHGVVSVASNLVPLKMKELTDACLEKNFMKALETHREMLPLFRALCMETNPIPIKAAMDLCGLASGPCRLPLCGLRQENRARLENILNNIIPATQPL